MSEPTQPSYMNSTLSQLAVGSAILYGFGALLVTTGVIYKGLDLNVAKSILAPFEFLLVTFGVSYLAVRKAGNGAGT